MEFLLEAIGEIGATHIVGLAIAVIVAVGAQPLGTVVTEWLRRLLNRSRKADASGPGLARPQPLRSHRQPGNRPARPFQGSTPEKLARSMRCFGRAPISHYRHQRWLVASWRAVKLYLLPVKTLPKSAFTAVDWHYEPSALTGLAAGHPFCGGFELRLRLHRHENRYHLQRSLRVGGLRSSRRVVVIASARDIFDTESWVRCLVVDADTLYLPKQSRGWVAVRGADPSSVDAPVVHRRRHKDVPDGAVWLIVPTSAYCPPAAAWGEAAERLDQQTRATIEAALTADCRDIDNEDYVRDWVKWNRKVTQTIWVVLGPVALVVAILALALASAFVERLPAAFETFVEVGIVTLGWYLSACAAVSGFACGHLLWETLAARNWRRLENQAQGDWKGGTDECIVVGRLIRRGPSLRPKQWAQHCDQALAQ